MAEIDIKKLRKIVKELMTYNEQDVLEYNTLLEYQNFHEDVYDPALYPNKRITKSDIPSKKPIQLIEMMEDIAVLSLNERAWIKSMLYSRKAGINTGILPPPPCIGSKCEGGGG